MTDRDTVSTGLATLTANGWVIVPGAAGGAGKQRVRFTGSGTFIVPAGVYELLFSGNGPGGGGGGGHTADPGGGGGGGAPGWPFENVPMKVLPGEVLTITMGAFGPGGAPGSNGSAGGSLTVAGGSLWPFSFRAQSGSPGLAGAAGVGGNGGAVSSLITAPSGGAGVGGGSIGSTAITFRGQNLFVSTGAAGGGPSNAGGPGTPRVFGPFSTPAGGAATGTQGGGGASGTSPNAIGVAGGAGGSPGLTNPYPGGGGSGGGALAAGGDGAPGFLDIEWVLGA